MNWNQHKDGANLHWGCLILQEPKLWSIKIKSSMQHSPNYWIFGSTLNLSAEFLLIPAVVTNTWLRGGQKHLMVKCESLLSKLCSLYVPQLRASPCTLRCTKTNKPLTILLMSHLPSPSSYLICLRWILLTCSALQLFKKSFLWGLHVLWKVLVMSSRYCSEWK